MHKSVVRLVSHVFATRGKYLRVNIPTPIARQFDIKQGDMLEWDIEEHNGEEVIIIRKAARK